MHNQTVVTSSYLDGIKEGRESFRQHGIAIAHEEIRNLRETIKGFAASSPVGQMLRGELDFWLNQVRKGEKS
jgi:hypothetical protein